MKKPFATIALISATILGAAGSPSALAETEPKISSEPSNVITSIPGDHYVVATWFTSNTKCQNYWNYDFYTKDVNNKLYSGHLYSPNSTGRYTLIAFYR